MDNSSIEKDSNFLNDPTRFYSHPRWDGKLFHHSLKPI